MGTYIVNDDRVMLTNDPVCMYDLGVYSFKIVDRHLKFRVVNDPCKIKLRGLNLSETEWSSCQVPNEEAAITGHWPKPDGCRKIKNSDWQ